MEFESLLDDVAARRRRRNRSRPTVTTVAKAAGVSRAAVSFAYNAPHQLSPATRQRILATAEQLGYSPDPVARMLTTRESGAIGLLMVEPIESAFADPFTAAFVRGMGQVCDRHGLALTLLPPRRGSSVDAVRSAIVDGVITLGLAADSPALATLQQRELPLVIVDGPPSDHWSSVLVDDETGAFQAARHLAGLGHRAVVVLSFAPQARGSTYYVPAQRLAGYQRGLAVPPTVIEAHSDVASGAGAISQLLVSTARPPTAILAMSDALALGALDACLRHGLRVPEDVSIIGYDDIPVAATASPPLTTVRQPVHEKAVAAMRLLLREITREPGAPILHEHDHLATELVVRASAGPARGA